ncbi:DUF397 domain-containing protein [Streptantibioticus rubrisoli]|uniref:DUF397 domain-containing protein n=1 Tax=Streptantibioticus rubrisoli TaxID=1387313 RepID=A0ABT1PJI8_9ACTN|nr:DUF397 domain-containing protein [Streptantibioticus rubrisoli]MCQ4045534.1 DUF397 domain-containing protein [Streptantibioticus rubrisoli]
MSDERAWFKSSYSGTEGGNCVEVAVSWRKSSYSDSEGGACVEVAACPQGADTVHVRDSKDKFGPQLAFTAAAWAEFIAFAARQGD